MKKFTKLFLAFVMSMGALSVFAAEHYVYFDGADTPIDEVEAEEGPAEYFTITGVQVNEPIEGQVIIERRGSKVVKRVY